ncbi:MAG TPA: arsenic resistance N-acetyltransferase ArsN2 [Gammaproteobacteria bacterium]|nr:arsenic resistance N-acetyltransferase ArsN2 [Gammaproteobacteria bacterium]
MNNEIRVAAYRVEDRPEIEAMLQMAELATSDLTPKMLADFLVARQDGVLVGVVGLERHAKAGLIRSLVVDKSLRGTGLGKRLLFAMEVRARGRGIKQLYLLTTTAEEFFLTQDYRPLDRLDAPFGIRHTQQFSTLCPASSTFMTKTLR